MSELDLVEASVVLPGRTLTILRPRNAEALLNEEAFEREEFLPYWAELWGSGEELSEEIAERDVAGLRVVELGCGLALPSLAAAVGGAQVLATDWSPDAIALVRENAQRNELALEAEVVRWSEPQAIVGRAPWDVVLAADVLYERRNVDELLELLPRLGDTVLLAEPGRPHATGFFERAAETWRIAQEGTVYTLTTETRGSASAPSQGGSAGRSRRPPPR